MRCPTCGKPVRKNQDICSYCGSLVTQIRTTESAPVPRDVTDFPGPVFTNWEMHPRGSIFDVNEVEAEEAQKRVRPHAPDIPAPSAPAEEEQPTTRRPVSLFRVVVILLFLLAPIFNSFLRNYVFDRPTSGPPVFREAGFCEQYTAGAPVNAKRTFSLQRDDQVVLYTEWRGARGDHAVSTRWYTPQGVVFAQPSSETRYEAGSREFAAISVLPLRGGMPEGQWKAEVLLDGQLRANLNFELQK